MPEYFDKALGKEKELTQEEIEEKKKKDEREVIDRIVRGVNDTFIKSYEYKDLGIKYTIKIKSPNALEQGQIQARLAAYLGGTNNYASEFYIIAFQALATLRVTGIDVPKELENDEDIYNMNMLYEIGRDFQQWLSNFRF